ncbi:EF-hand domain-containing protein [Niveispirillum lacus]|nr:EF-hand domain-containing protein [Niveispirillum lacus]
MSISSISGSISALTSIGRPPQAQERFEAADTDKSGGLSLEEFQAAGPKDADKTGRTGTRPSAEDMFARMDSDGDGALTQGEMETAFQSMRSEMKGTLLAAQEAASGTSRTGSRPAGPPPDGPPPEGEQTKTASSAASSSPDIASLLSTGSSTGDDDTVSTLISQLQSAIGLYSQKNTGNRSNITSQAA